MYIQICFWYGVVWSGKVGYGEVPWGPEQQAMTCCIL